MEHSVEEEAMEHFDIHVEEEGMEHCNLEHEGVSSIFWFLKWKCIFGMPVYFLFSSVQYFHKVAFLSN